MGLSTEVVVEGTEVRRQRVLIKVARVVTEVNKEAHQWPDWDRVNGRNHTPKRRRRSRGGQRMNIRVA